MISMKTRAAAYGHAEVQAHAWIAAWGLHEAMIKCALEVKKTLDHLEASPNLDVEKVDWCEGLWMGFDDFLRRHSVVSPMGAELMDRAPGGGLFWDPDWDVE